MLSVCLFVQILYVQVNILSLCQDELLFSFLERVKCLAKGHNTMTPVSLELETLRSPV